MAEAAARATAPASVSKMIGDGGELAGQTAKDLDRAIDLLKGYLTEDRLDRMQEVLDQRTGSAAIVFENPANPNNVSLSPSRTQVVCTPGRHYDVGCTLSASHPCMIYQLISVLDLIAAPSLPIRRRVTLNRQRCPPFVRA